MTRLPILVLMCTAAFAQIAPGPIGPGGPGLSLALRQYLDLTNEQVATMVRLNNEFARLQAEKLRRQVQVNMELSQEMRRETLDPMAIGVRFVELEAIRREIAAEQARITRQVQALLTPAQRTGAQALQEVLRTYPIACEALAHRLIVAPAAPDATSALPPGASGIGGFLLGAPVCAVGGLRTGDFSFIPGMGMAAQEPASAVER